MNLEEFFQRVWKDRNYFALGLWPISLLYRFIVGLRRIGYSSGLFAVEKFNYPIIVIGNLTVGGTGKTPLTIWAIEELKNAGYQPGVISRGYGRESTRTLLVQSDSTPELVGDEPLLIWHRTGAPVAVAKKRADAVRLLMNQSDCNVIVSDDGLQHLSIESDLKILLIDAKERFGNGFCLPAGPLREGVGNARKCDITIVNGIGQANEFSMECKLTEVVNILDGSKKRGIESLSEEKVSAVAGVRHPHRFFELLNTHGIDSQNFSFPDHHEFSKKDFDAVVDTNGLVLMTEKDAVKCTQFAKPNWWYVKFEATPESSFQKVFAEKIAAITG